jgi:hypothetical protein
MSNPFMAIPLLLHVENGPEETGPYRVTGVAYLLAASGLVSTVAA